MLLQELQAQRAEILLLADKYGFENVRVFGSVARGEETPESDIDFLVLPREGVTLFDLMDLKHGLHQLLGRPADVVSERGLYWYLKDKILQSAKPL